MARPACATWPSLAAPGLALALHAAAANAAPADRDLADWLAANTDMTAAQVVIAGPESVYTLEPLGPRAATGEQIVLVRTERLDAPGPAAGPPSWEAHLLFDCRNGRLREIRGATFPLRNRKGAPLPDQTSDAWVEPKPGQPAAQLLAAACDATFAWPLRPVLTAEAALPAPPPAPALPPPDAPVRERSGPQTIILSPTPPDDDASPAPAAQPAAPPSPFGVQVARGPSEEGANRALARARKTLGAQAAGLDGRIERSKVGDRRRFTAVFFGFPTAEAATAACQTLEADGQPCLLRGLPPPPPISSAAPPDAFAVQVARGPSEEGAKRALAAARETLGAGAEGLVVAIEQSRVGDKRRYIAVLAGFASPEAAAQACKVLVEAGQSCLTRKPAVAEAPAP